MLKAITHQEMIGILDFYSRDLGSISGQGEVFVNFDVVSLFAHILRANLGPWVKLGDRE